MRILVSACLMGERCKYDGGNNYSPAAACFAAGHEVIAVCPEVMGGLPVPRAPAEIVGGVVRTKDGASVDAAFRAGAYAALGVALRERPDMAILQSRSPSCGVNEVYDGTFSGRKIAGRGLFADLLVRHGFSVRDVEDLSAPGAGDMAHTAG